mgnify:CR=1 FL=1
MAVPSSNSHLKNTSNGVFIHAKQGGTILNNNSTTVTNSTVNIGDGVITKAFELDDANNYDRPDNMLPRVSASGIYNVAKALSGGTFGYSAAGKYVIARASDTLSGVSKTNLIFMGAGGTRNSIAQFQGDMGAKLLTAWRQNQWSWLGTLDSGATITNMRTQWLNVAGTAAASPVSLNGVYMWSESAGAAAKFADNAANPTRAIPGELVMKVDFVKLDITGTGDNLAGDFFDYKPITGM